MSLDLPLREFTPFYLPSAPMAFNTPALPAGYAMVAPPAIANHVPSLAESHAIGEFVLKLGHLHRADATCVTLPELLEWRAFAQRVEVAIGMLF